MFEKATKLKVRFPFKGSISVEDLWDLTVTELDSIYKFLNSKLKLTQEESLLNRKSAADEVLELQIEIIKHIVATKQKEAADKVAAKERAAKKQKIMQIMEAKQDNDLQNKTADELKKMLEELN